MTIYQFAIKCLAAIGLVVVCLVLVVLVSWAIWRLALWKLEREEERQIMQGIKLREREDETRAYGPDGPGGIH